MTIRQAIGFILGMSGVWLMWTCGVGMAEYVAEADGAKSVYQLLFDPEYALRFLTALAAFTGGLAALVEKSGGAWLTGITAFIFGILIFGMIGNSGNVAEWREEAVILICLTGLFLALVVARNAARERGEIAAEGEARQKRRALEQAEAEAARTG